MAIAQRDKYRSRQLFCSAKVLIIALNELEGSKEPSSSGRGQTTIVQLGGFFSVVTRGRNKKGGKCGCGVLFASKVAGAGAGTKFRLSFYLRYLYVIPATRQTRHCDSCAAPRQHINTVSTFDRTQIAMLRVGICLRADDFTYQLEHGLPVVRQDRMFCSMQAI